MTPAAAVTSDDFPNARIRLRLRSKGPGVAERTIEQTIWLRGARFHIRDDAGRSPSEIIADVTAPGGLGDAPRTMEALMDRASTARRPSRGPTDIYGDLAADTAQIHAPNTKPWSRPARDVAPVARQPLADDRAAGLAAGASAPVLGRTATEYRGEVEVTEDGRSRKNAVVRLIDPPFLLLDDARAADNAHHFYVREVIALDLGVVIDADLTPP